ncbi:hypothetical protein [Actinacidiphila bryophytorum]|uniref:hypothetical protein n=1 Tax=Actinacidiphila bryophytorum TaxID=1436133 RepID=UPI002176EB1F|nr:hypothetical protein [Actinacidiphila bryophytorum]UWE11020.1 hypothetical protein NYE86_21415 [Actinacidiphila bryophytorum]
MPGEQPRGLLARQHVEGHGAGAVRGDQAGEPAAAGDQHPAGRAARQQRRDLRGVAGVVQHEQHPPARGEAAEERGRGLLPGRDRRGLHPQGIEEAVQHRRRLGGPASGVEAAQVRVQLAVGEAVLARVRPVQGQPGLADPAHPADRADAGCAGSPRCDVQGGVQVGEFAGAAGEGPRRGGQLARHGAGRQGPGRRGSAAGAALRRLALRAASSIRSRAVASARCSAGVALSTLSSASKRSVGGRVRAVKYSAIAVWDQPVRRASSR